MLSKNQAEMVLDTAMDAAQKAMAALADAIQADDVVGYETQVAVTALAFIHSKALALCSLHPQYQAVFDSIVRTTGGIELATLRVARDKDSGEL